MNDLNKLIAEYNSLLHISEMHARANGMTPILKSMRDKLNEYASKIAAIKAADAEIKKLKKTEVGSWKINYSPESEDEHIGRTKNPGKIYPDNLKKEEVEQVDEDGTVRAWTKVHTTGTKAQRDRLDKAHAKNPKYQEFKKGLEGHSGVTHSEKPKAAEKPAAAPEHKPSGETLAQKLRRINAERVKKAMEKGSAHRSPGVGSAGSSANLSPLEKKLGGHSADVSSLEKKKTTALGGSPAEREATKAKKKEEPTGNERKPGRLTGRKLSMVGEELKVGDKDEKADYKAEKKIKPVSKLSRVARKYLGRQRGKTATGSKAHEIKTDGLAITTPQDGPKK
jgi:hypothetical protein